MAFPTSPTNGQQANINGITYTYSSALTAWTVSTSVSNTFVSINVSDNVNSGNLLATGLASVSGNVAGAYFIGNGSQLTGVVSSYGNANVVANLAALGSNPISSTGNITGGNLSGTNIVGTLTTAAQTNITAVGTLGSLTVTANTTSGNLLTGGLISATGNITGGNILGGANVNATTHTGTTVSVTANVTGGNLLTGGLISAAGNISANNATFTSNQTLSYGTANGVIYLNSSKVATSGTALVFDGTNLGIGTTTPSTGKFSDASYAFLIQSASTSTGTNIFASNSDNSKFVGFWSGHSSAEPAVGVKTGNAFTFGKWAAINGTGGFTENMRISSDGVLQVGRTGGSAPDGKLQVIASGTGAGAANTKLGFALIEDDSGNAAGLWLGSMTNQNTGVIGSRTASGNIAFQTYNGGWGERVRITYDGNLLVGTTANVFGARLNVVPPYAVTGASFESSNSTYSAIVTWNNQGNYPANQIAFHTGTSSPTEVGKITSTATTTSYTSPSDYRLKENIAPMTGALNTVALLKPVTYKWKADGSDGEGFIAHELAEVVPHAVTGEKDAVNEEGKPVHQGVDTSFLIVTLTAAIQEQQALIQSLTARITALEGA